MVNAGNSLARFLSFSRIFDQRSVATLSTSALLSALLVFGVIDVVRASEASSNVSRTVTNLDAVYQIELDLERKRFTRPVAEVLVQSAADGSIASAEYTEDQAVYETTALYFDGVYVRSGEWLEEAIPSSALTSILDRYQGSVRVQAHPNTRDSYVAPYSLTTATDSTQLSSNLPLRAAIAELVNHEAWRGGMSLVIVIDSAMTKAESDWVREHASESSIEFVHELPIQFSTAPTMSVIEVHDNGQMDVVAESAQASYTSQYSIETFPDELSGMPLNEVITVDEGTRLRVVDVDNQGVVGEMLDIAITADLKVDWSRLEFPLDAFFSADSTPENSLVAVVPDLGELDIKDVQRAWLKAPESFSEIGKLDGWRVLPNGVAASENYLQDIRSQINNSALTIPLHGELAQQQIAIDALNSGELTLVIDSVLVDIKDREALSLANAGADLFEQTDVDQASTVQYKPDSGAEEKPLSDLWLDSSLAKESVRQLPGTEQTNLTGQQSKINLGNGPVNTFAFRSNTTNVVSSIDNTKPSTFGLFDDGFDVGMTGEANYRVPIKLPEAPGGIVPGLSLSYSSAAGQGVAGIGWSLQGLSSIHRCAMSYARDGKHRGVQFDADDRYCIDGKRLVGTAGVYGTDEAQYRTEQNNFDAVKSKGATIFGPAYWTIQDKAGFDFQFGRGLDGFGDVDEGRIPGVRINGTNDNRINTWALTRVQDKKGNRFNVRYARSIDSAPQATADSSFEVEHIRYGDDANTQINVYFDYFSQEVDQDGVGEYRYLDDRRFSSNKFLKSIDIYRGAPIPQNLIGTYRFEYSVNAEFERWRLVKLQYCGKDQCLQSKSFEWRERPVPGGGGAWDSPGVGFGIEDSYVIDLNGDGRSDILGRLNGTQWKYCLSTGSANNCYDTTLFDTHYVEPGDYNGDGKTDLIFGTREANSLQIDMRVCETKLSSTDLFGALTFQCASVPELNRGPYTNADQVSDIVDGTSNYVGGNHDDTYQGDFNADGRTDFLRATNSNAFRICFWQPNASAKFTCRNMVTNRDFNVSGQTAYSTFMGGNLIPADFNGDGATDFAVGRRTPISDFIWQICTATDPTRLLFPNTDAEKSYDCTNRAVPLNTVQLTHVGDFNGDGLADLTRKVGNTDGKWLMCLSTGSTLDCEDWLDGPNVPFSYTRAADFNGDGRTDIGGAETERGWGTSGSIVTQSWTLGMSTPGGFENIPGVNWTKPLGPEAIVGDFNGDGRHEIAGFQEAQGTVQIILSQEAVQSLPLLATVLTDGMPSHLSAHHGRALAINYAYEEPQVEAQQAFPVRQVNRPVLVVRSTTTPSHIVPVRNEILYNFSDLRANVRGLGSLGFASRSVEDVQNKTKSESTYSQVYPIAGAQRTLKNYLKQGQAFKEVSSTTNTMRVKASNGAILNPYTDGLNNQENLLSQYAPYFIYTSESTTDTRHYVSGNLLKTEKTTHADVSLADQGFDAFGNAKYLKQEIIDRKLNGGDGNDMHWTTVTRSEYAGNGSNGQLTNSRVVYSTNAPGAGASIAKESSFSYDANGQLTVETIEPDFVSGNNLQKSQYLRTSYQYDVYGNEANILQVGFKHNGQQQNRNTLIETTYLAASADAPGAPPVKRVKTTNAVGHESYAEYHLNHGKVVYTKDPNGFKSIWQYDEFGGYVDTTSHIGVREWIEFHGYVGAADPHAPPNAFSRLMERESGQLRITTYFDSNGNTLRKMTGGFTAGDVIYVDAEFDRLNRKVLETVPYYRGSEGNESNYLYWGFTDKPRTVYNSDDTVVTYAYGDNWSRATTSGTSMLDIGEEEDFSRIQQQFYYANGSIHQVRNGPSTGFSKLLKRYDALGRLRFTQDDMGNRIVLTYDLRDRKIRQVDPDMGRWDYRYTSYGELSWQRDAKLNTTVNLYDEIGRLTSTINADGRTNRYYDDYNNSIGQQTREIHLVPGQQAHYRTWTWYNVKGLPSRQDTCVANGRTTGEGNPCPAGTTSRYRFNYTYDGVGRPRFLTYPGGKKLEHKYLRGHLSELNVDGQQIWRVDSKTALGQTKLQTQGNGLKTDYAFDVQNRLSQINVDNDGSPSLLKRYEYHLSDGSLKLRHDFNHDLQEYFGYDAHGRLQNQHVFQGDGIYSNRYEYDILGNITQKPDLAELVGKTFQYGENGAGPHALTSIGNRTFSYDANGSSTNDGERSIEWTAFNKPSSITSNGDLTNKTEFLYGSGFKRAVRSNANSTITYLDASFAGDAHFEEEETTNGVKKKWYYSVGGRTLAIDSKDTGGQESRLFAHHDRLGSIVALSDTSRVIVERMSYDPWGKRRELNGSESSVISGQNLLHGFTGHEMLDEHALIHMNGRINDPSLGRFLSADPFVQYTNNPQSYNRYSYILNDPLGGTDPTGYLRLSNEEIAIVGAVIFVAASGGTGILLAGALGGAELLIVSAAVGGALSGASMTLMSGGSTRDAFQNAIIGASFSSVSAGIAQSIGIGLANRPIAKMLAHGSSQGAISEVRGGTFRAGFVGGLVGDVIPGVPESRMIDVALATFAGGVSSQLSGGKFSQGATSAAFVRLFNHGSEILEGSAPAPRNIAEPTEHAEIAELLTDLGTQAAIEIDVESPHLREPWLMWLRGIRIHSRFKSKVDALGNEFLHTEQSYYKTRPTFYGRPGSIRADVVYGDVRAPFFAMDLKTGAAFISNNQSARYTINLPKGTALYELKVP